MWIGSKGTWLWWPCCVLLFGCDPSTSQSQPPDAVSVEDPVQSCPWRGEDERLKLVLLGDSITKHGLSGPGVPFAETLEVLLGDRFEVVNIGVNGASSLDWAPSRSSETLPVDLYDKYARPAMPADVVTIMVGTNDLFGTLEKGEVAVEDYDLALNEIVDTLLGEGAQHVVLMPPPRPSCLAEGKTELINSYRARLLRLCTDASRVHCGPDSDSFLEPGDMPDDCGVHPAGSGHDRIAKHLAAALSCE